jgi:hypothetical protein
MDFVFNHLGPQEDTPVVEHSEVTLPADCVPNPMQVEGELVSTRSHHVEPCPAQGTSHMFHRER